MKPTKTFNMSRTTKYLLAQLPFTDQHQRSAFKEMMIQAQLQGAIKVKAEPKKAWTSGTPLTGQLAAAE